MSPTYADPDLPPPAREPDPRRDKVDSAAASPDDDHGGPPRRRAGKRHRSPNHRTREHRRRRLRRHGRRAYIRSVYFLPSLATLGNAVCGFGAMYVAAAAAISIESGADQYVFRDPWARFMAHHGFVAAAYLIFIAMIFDALDGRLARFT